MGRSRIPAGWSESDRRCIAGLRMIIERRRLHTMVLIGVKGVFLVATSSALRVVRELIVVYSILLVVELLANTEASIFLISIHFFYVMPINVLFIAKFINIISIRSRNR